MKPTPGRTLDLDEEDLMTVKGDQLHRIMLHSALIISVLYTVFNHLNGDYWETIITASLIPITAIAWLLFNTGHHLASKVLNLIQVNIAILLLSLTSGPQTFVVIFYIPALIGALIVLQGKERNLGYAGAALSVILLAFSVTTELRLGNVRPLGLAQQRVEWILNGVGAALVTITQVVFIMRINNIMYHRLVERTQDLRAQQEHLMLTIRARDKIMSILSHDLRSPLLLLRSGLDMLKPGSMSADKQEQLAEQLGLRTKHTVDLLENLLQWSHDHSISLAFKLRAEETDQLKRYADECFFLFGRDKDIHFQGRFEHRTGTRVLCDMRMIQTVFRNLITNAFKFTPAGGQVVVSGQEVGDRFEFRVTNTGKPMEPEQVQRILRGESFTLPGTNAETGHGLGLQLVQDLLRLHGSSLKVESSEAAGNSFCFTLPIC